MEIGQFFTLDILSSIAGMVAAIMLITQFTKGGMDFIFNQLCKGCGLTTNGIPTQLWVVVLSECLLFTVMYFNYALPDRQSIFIAAINGLVLAGVAMESYNALQSKPVEPIIVEDTAKEE
jgi:hypothetical protein